MTDFHKFLLIWEYGKTSLERILEQKDCKIATIEHVQQGLLLAHYIGSERLSNDTAPIWRISFVHRFFYLFCSKLQATIIKLSNEESKKYTRTLHHILVASSNQIFLLRW